MSKSCRSTTISRSFGDACCAAPASPFRRRCPIGLILAESAWLAARAGSNPSALIERVLVGLMPKIPERLNDGTLREYLETVEIDGLPLWRHGFWNLLARGMSADGYNAARATVGYDLFGRQHECARSHNGVF